MQAFRLDPFDLDLLRESRTEQRRFERGLVARPDAGCWAAIAAFTRHASAAWDWRSAARAAFDTAVTAVRRLTGLAKLLRLKAMSPAFRRAALAAGITATATVAWASALVVQGYVQHDEDFWNERIADFTQSPIYGPNGNGGVTLVGSRSQTPDGELARKYGFIPLQGAIPPVYLEALLFAENRKYRDWSHNWCGLDPVTSVGSFIHSGGSAGGSTITQQLARGLKPEWGREDSLFDKASRKFLEIGASCHLYRTLTRDGDRDAPLRLYASYAGIWQGGGSLRGLEAASRITWGKAPDELNDAQQIVLAAAARHPLALVDESNLAIPCATVYPRRKNPEFSADVARAHPGRKGQCHVLARAEWIARNLLDGDRLAAALMAIAQLRAKGIHPVNDFRPVPAKRLINLVSRTAAALPATVLRQIAAEADAADLPPGAPLMLAFDAPAQYEFTRRMGAALKAIERERGPGFCLPLQREPGGDTGSVPPSLRCGREIPGDALANVLAIKADIVTGAMMDFFATTPLLLDSEQSMGSLDKLFILLAAVANGYTAESRVCPRQAFDGVRRLRRVTIPVLGYPDCAGGAHMITLLEATARSDSLAYYGLAKSLGDEKLRSALDAVGIAAPADGTALAYALAFGTASTTPRSMLGAAQALFAVAYGVRTTGTAPRVLALRTGAPNPAVGRVRALVPREDQRVVLRALAEAAVQHPHGTLHFLAGGVDAGKSGTLSSTIKGFDGIAYDAGKLMVAFNERRGTLMFFYAASPLPSIPLAHRSIAGSVFASAHRVLIDASQGKP